MTLREKILKTFIVTIREVNTHGGPEKFFAKYPVGGMYYGEGTVAQDETGQDIGSQMTYEDLLACKQHANYKLWICAGPCMMRDQTIRLHAKSLAASPNLEEDAYNYGKIMGMQMNEKGIDHTLDPAIDMCFNHYTIWGLSNDPELTARIYRQVVRGIRDQGVCTTAKHFPGLGTNYINTHLAPGNNIFPFDRWMQTYGYTYKEMFQENVDSVMTAHLALKSYDNESHDGFYPIATYSEKLTTELLKNKLGFKGAVLTDAMVMGGMSTGDLIAETVQAFKAGADLLLWVPVEAAEVIEQKILSGEIPLSRLEDALARIERMKAFRLHALESKAFDTPDPEFADRSTKQLMENAICLLRNDIGLLPLKPQAYRSVLIVNGTEQEHSTACTLLKAEFDAHGIRADIVRGLHDVSSWVCWQNDIDSLQDQYDLVIFNIDTHYAIMNDALMHVWASHMFSKQKKIIVNYGSAYFAEDYFPEDPTFVQMNCPVYDFTVKALFNRLMGTELFTGKPYLK